jgi:2'-5' RNA ligase
MRLFVALDIDDNIRERIARFIGEVRGFAPEARWVRPESLHVTLKFIGEGSEDDVEKITQALASIEFAAIELNVHGYGFFPGNRAAKAFWAGIEAGPNLASLAETVDERLARAGISSEQRSFTPHLTLARGSRSGNLRKKKGHDSIHGRRSFQRLQEDIASRPALEFGRMTSREFFLYQSQLSADGSKYSKLAAFSLQERFEHKS